MGSANTPLISTIPVSTPAPQAASMARRFTTPPVYNKDFKQTDIAAYFNRSSTTLKVLPQNTQAYKDVVAAAIARSFKPNVSSSSTGAYKHPSVGSVFTYLPPVANKVTKPTPRVVPHLGTIPPIGGTTTANTQVLMPVIQPSIVINQPVDVEVKTVPPPSAPLQTKEPLPELPFLPSEPTLSTIELANLHCNAILYIKDTLYQLTILIRQFLRYHSIHVFDIPLECLTPEVFGSKFQGMEEVGHPLRYVSQLMDRLSDLTKSDMEKEDLNDFMHAPYNWLYRVKRSLFFMASYTFTGWKNLQSSADHLYVKMYSVFPESVPVEYGKEFLEFRLAPPSATSINALDLPESDPFCMIPIEDRLQEIIDGYKEKEEKIAQIPRMSVNISPAALECVEGMICNIPYHFSRVRETMETKTVIEYSPNKVQEIINVICDVSIIIEKSLFLLYSVKEPGMLHHSLPNNLIRLIYGAEHIQDQFRRSSSAQLQGFYYNPQSFWIAGCRDNIKLIPDPSPLTCLETSY